MKAILKFNLEEIDDVMEHKRCIKSLDMALAIYEIQYNLRKSLYNEIERMEENDTKSNDPNDIIDLVLLRINDVIDEHNIDIDDLII